MIDCRSCRSRVADSEAAIAASWSCLEITGRWRCPACCRVLREAASIVGPIEATFSDPLPLDSIGALKKGLAETILPVSVKA